MASRALWDTPFEAGQFPAPVKGSVDEARAAARFVVSRLGADAREVLAALGLTEHAPELVA